MPGQNPSQAGLTGRRLCGTELHKLLQRTEGPEVKTKKDLKEQESRITRASLLGKHCFMFQSSYVYVLQ